MSERREGTNPSPSCGDGVMPWTRDRMSDRTYEGTESKKSRDGRIAEKQSPAETGLCIRDPGKHLGRAARTDLWRGVMLPHRRGHADAGAGLAAQGACDVRRIGDQAEAAADEIDQRRDLGPHAAGVELCIGLVPARLRSEEHTSEL